MDGASSVRSADLVIAFIRLPILRAVHVADFVENGGDEVEDAAYAVSLIFLGQLHLLL